MAQRGNTADYADAFVELYKIAAMLDVWDKCREAEVLTAILHDDNDKLKNLSVNKAEMLALHSEIMSALKDANCPDGVVYAVDEIFKTPLSTVGVKVGHRKLAAKTKKKEETTVEKLSREVSERPRELTRPTETAKIKPKPPVPFRTNLDYGEPIPKSETSSEYFAKLNLSSMPAEEPPKTGYDGLNDLYSRKPNEDVNKKRFRQTSQGHKEEGVLIVPAYMNNGIMYRGDMVHIILENIARRDTTGLSVYVGAVPLNKEELNNIGDLAMRLVMKDNDMVAQKLSGIIFSSIYKMASDMDADQIMKLQKTAYNNNAFESYGQVDREVLYPVRPESNILQYAHDDKMISIDRRSLSGVIMRADVKNKVLTRLSLQRPLGKTATELKVYYIKMIEAGGAYKAARFKKAVKELYNVDCGELDDKIIDMAHEKSVKLEDIENALFPTLDHQQQIDVDAATSRPVGEVSDSPVRFAFIDRAILMDRYVTAKREKQNAGDEDSDEGGEVREKFLELLGPECPHGQHEIDEESEDVGSVIPEGVQVVELGGPKSKEESKNVSVNVNTDPDTGRVKVYLNGSLDKEFGSMEEAIEWASKVSQIFNNVLDSSSNVVASIRFSELSKLATVYNGFVSYLVKVATFSHNIKEMLGLLNDIA